MGIAIGSTVTDSRGRRGKVVAEDSSFPHVKMVRIDGVDYADGDATPIHEANLTAAEAPKAQGGWSGKRIMMTKGTYEGAMGVVEGEPVMGPGTALPITLDNGVHGRWSADWFKLDEAAEADARGGIRRVAGQDVEVVDGVLGMRRVAQEPVPAPPEGALAEEEFGLEMEATPPPSEQTPDAQAEGERMAIEREVLELIDQELRGMFTSTVVPQATVTGVEPLPETDGYAVILEFEDTPGTHRLTGTALVQGDRLFLPTELYSGDQKVGEWAEMKALFHELPEGEGELIQEMESAAAAGKDVNPHLNKMLERHGADAYRRAFARFANIDAEKDRVHTLLAAGGDRLLKAFLMERGCEACGKYVAASAHNFEPLCAKARKRVLDTSKEECEADEGE